MTTQEGATMTDETVGDKQLWFIAEAIVVGKFGIHAVYRELQRMRDEAIATQAAQLGELREELGDCKGQLRDMEARRITQAAELAEWHERKADRARWGYKENE